MRARTPSNGMNYDDKENHVAGVDEQRIEGEGILSMRKNEEDTGCFRKASVIWRDLFGTSW